MLLLLKNRSDWFFLYESIGRQNAHIRLGMLRYCRLASHKNSLIIYDF